MKERLDKYVKDALIGLCDLLDVSVAKASPKKVGNLFAVIF